MLLLRASRCCILSKFYIKPQPHRVPEDLFRVVSYRNSTSNHNKTLIPITRKLLYLIEILHQTTTMSLKDFHDKSCILSKFYIKPQQSTKAIRIWRSCILSKFYIKPQQKSGWYFTPRVVSYRNSTSNHNYHLFRISRCSVVSYRNSTSNHNRVASATTRRIVVSYRNSTSNHNTYDIDLTTKIVVSYRNSTSNHNRIRELPPCFSLYLIEILHQTTT